MTGLEIPLLLGALYCLINAAASGSHRTSQTTKPRPTKASWRAIRQTLGRPDESTPYRDKYKFPDGEIVVYIYLPANSN